MQSVNKEITLIRQSCVSDNSDPLVLWVRGREKDVQCVLNTLGDKVSSCKDMGVDGSIDFKLPDQSADLMAAVDDFLAGQAESSFNCASITNYYRCVCGEGWELGDCDSFHNDRCPECNKEIEPYNSIEDAGEA